ncbi:MAG: pyrroline-5-carboxylate reductase [Bergeyella sp.]|nr:pyrroline-5-carboxylate reductase [Bergeyella sp.]
MDIVVLGAGKMGTSFSASFFGYEQLSPQSLHFIVRKPEKKERISKLFPGSKVSVFSEVKELYADIVILSIKPQDFSYVSEHLPFKIPKEAVLLSIMAGISVEKIKKAFDHELVVRAMPNAPTLIGMGITGYTATSSVSFRRLIQIERLLATTGRSVYLEDEKLLDSLAAISGSGPAYFYYIMEAMIKTGMEMGFEENLSKILVNQTMLGAYHLVNSSDKSLAELIQDVASKGGITEAALKYFKENKLSEIIGGGIRSAQERAKALNR